MIKIIFEKAAAIVELPPPPPAHVVIGKTFRLTVTVARISVAGWRRLKSRPTMTSTPPKARVIPGGSMSPIPQPDGEPHGRPD